MALLLTGVHRAVLLEKVPTEERPGAGEGPGQVTWGRDGRRKCPSQEGESGVAGVGWRG